MTPKTCLYCRNYESMRDVYCDDEEPDDQGRCLAYEDPDGDGEMWFSIYEEDSYELRDMDSCRSFERREP